MFCSYCGAEINEKAAVCLNCGVSVKKSCVDKAGAGWWWLGFLFPIVGLFIWIFCNDSEPNKAKKAGIGALVGFIVSVVFTIIITMVYIFGIAFFIMTV